MSGPHYLYRCFDEDGRLLYIGCTSNVEKRMSVHRSNRRQKASRWLRVCMDRYEVDGPFLSLEAARGAERDAIAAERPLFNLDLRQTPGWQLCPAVAAYLIDQGHADLARETACTCWSETRAAGEFDEWCVAHLHPALAGTSP